MTDTQLRIVKVPLSVGQIRRMDQLLSAGKGGYQTRAEFIADAIDGLILELSYETAPEPNEPPAALAAAVSSQTDRPKSLAPDLSISALRPPPSGAVLEEGVARAGLLFGLHNRDYPTLWALEVLMQMTQDRAVPFSEFVRRVTEAAWEQGRALMELEAVGGQKFSAMFPTNRSKVPAAEGRFRAFAIGGCEDVAGVLRTAGPFFEWQVASVAEVEGRIVIGPTIGGYALMRSLTGITVHEPHDTQYATSFLQHLKLRAPADWAGFDSLLEILGESVTREELVTAFSTRWPELGGSEVATDAAGYVARAREWGLVAPKQVRGRYELTDFGAGIRHDWGQQ
jgi:hypothetical protein